MLKFTGVIQHVEEAREGTTKAGEPYASREFKVTEANPANPNYPQTAKFTTFKKGEYVEYATTKFPTVGSIVDIEFNLNLREGEGRNGKPYSIQELKTWSIRTQSSGQQPTNQPTNQPQYEEQEDDLPF